MTTKEALFEYTVRLGDNALILGHRLSEWCGHGPVLEQDIALINISLDLIGQARLLLEYAGKVEEKNRTEDDLAYLRDVFHFKNVLLTEQPNQDFGYTIIRQLMYDVYSHLFYTELKNSKDETLSAIAEKSLKEVTYHLKYSSEWAIRLGDGTEESHQRIQTALNDYWMYSGELFEMDDVDNQLLKEGIAVDLSKLKVNWDKKIDAILEEAKLSKPENNWMASGGKAGNHGEHLGYILAEMQYLQRAYPNCEW